MGDEEIDELIPTTSYKELYEQAQLQFAEIIVYGKSDRERACTLNGFFMAITICYGFNLTVRLKEELFKWSEELHNADENTTTTTGEKD